MLYSKYIYYTPTTYIILQSLIKIKKGTPFGTHVVINNLSVQKRVTT